MTTTTTFGALGSQIAADIDAELRRRRGLVVASVLEEIQTSAPRVEGRFAASFEVFSGSPSHGFSAEGSFSEQSAADAAKIAESVPLEATVGIATAAPHARRIALHGASRRAPKNWLTVAIQDGVRSS